MLNFDFVKKVGTLSCLVSFQDAKFFHNHVQIHITILTIFAQQENAQENSKEISIFFNHFLFIRASENDKSKKICNV